MTNDEDEDDDDDYEEQDSQFENGYFGTNPIRTPFISPDQRRQAQSQSNNNNFPLLAILVAALRKSIVTCSVDTEDVASTSSSSMDIGCPTDVKHVSHVTFDRFNGFLGLPVELEPEVSRKVPSASVRVFGVSAESMQCTYDQRGNSVPTILLMMQKRLYSGGGLQAEGIFRINAENSQEEYVRNQLNEGFVPHGIDVHCLAGLIKAWFRELPTGVLDSLTPEQVMHCNSEEECTLLVKSLPPTEAALLDWAINLMADVVKHEHDNKMNARNIAMVFAPNMTQMADPLTALIHAVQVMNLLKTLIIKSLREREESAAAVQTAPPSSDSFSSKGESYSLRSNSVVSSGQTIENSLLRSATISRLESDSEEKFWSFQSRSDVTEEQECVSGRSSPVSCKRGSVENGVKSGYDDEHGEVEVGILDRLSLRKGVKKLCRHPVFQLSKPAKKGGGGIGIVNTRGGGGEAWA